MFVSFLERFDLPMPELNYHMDGRVVDAFYRREGVIVELDSFRFHKTRAVFERDRKTDAEATARGLATIRITDARMKGAAEEEAANLAATLRRRYRQW